MQDPYFNKARCVQRLVEEYRIHGKLIIALDFDDTVYDFHGKGYVYDEVLDLVRDCQSLGFYIILFTGTHPDKYDMQIRYLAERGIFIAHINCNPIPLPFGNHGKPYFNCLLDDRGGLESSFAILTEAVKEIRTLQDVA